MEDKKENKSKKKNVIIWVSIIFVVLLICIGAGAYYYYTMEQNKISEINLSQKEALKDFSEEVKYGQEISYDELLDKLVDTSKLQENTSISIKINDKELSKEETFKFEQLGTYTVNVKIKNIYTYSIINFVNKNIENEKTLEIIIEDKEKPTITGASDKEITVGDNLNLQEGIKATDNIDGEVEVKIEGTVDNQKPGSYSIKALASDKSGNIEEATFTVTVKEKPKADTSTSSNAENKNSGSSTSSGSNKNSGSSTSTSSGSNGSSNNTANKAGSAKEYIQDILRLTNQYRKEKGIAALLLDSKLSSAAQKRATELVSTPSHTRPNGTSCFTVLDEYGIDSWSCGENIAYGQSNGTAAAQWWRNSSGHYKNMTSTEFNKIGIGAYYSGSRWYWVQLFTN